MADSIVTLSKQLETIAAQLRQLSPPIVECAVLPPTTNVPAPPSPSGAGCYEGRLVYEGCYAAKDPNSGKPVMTLLGTVPAEEPVAVLECARRATAAGPAGGGPVTFGVQKGTECWMASDALSARRGGAAMASRCAGARPDGRGHVTGGPDALAVYTYLPPGVEARFLRIVRKVADRSVQPADPTTTHLHLEGVAVFDGTGRAVAIADASSGNGSNLLPLPDPQPGEPAADRTTTELADRHRIGGSRGVCNAGASVGASLTFFLAEDARIRSVHVRNRSVPGRRDIEDRLRGCWVQLFRDDPSRGLAPAWERPIVFGAPAYQFDVW